jgi:hypothetical protein
MGIVSRSPQRWQTSATVGTDGDLVVSGVAGPETAASAATAVRAMGWRGVGHPVDARKSKRRSTDLTRPCGS